MKISFTMIPLLFCCHAFCQQELELFKQDSYGRPLYLTVAFPTKGSPYFSDEYHNAQITAVNGSVYNGIRVKINLVDHVIQYLSSDGAEMITDMPVKKIVLTGITPESGISYNAVLQSFQGALNSRDAIVYEVLDSGKVSLVKKTTIIYRDEKNYNEASTTRVYERKESLYFTDAAGLVKKLEKGKPAILELFSDKKEKVATFIAHYNLDCKSAASLKTIFRFYNSSLQ